MDEKYEGVEVLVFDNSQWVSLLKLPFVEGVNPNKYIKVMNEWRNLFYDGDKVYVDAGSELDIVNYSAFSISTKDKMFKFRLF